MTKISLKKIYKYYIQLCVYCVLITAFLIPVFVIMNEDSKMLIDMIYIHTYCIFVYYILKIFRGD